MNLPCTTIKKTKNTITIEYPEINLTSNIDIIFRVKNGKIKYKTIQYIEDDVLDIDKFKIPDIKIEQNYNLILSHKKYNIDTNISEICISEILEKIRSILVKIRNVKDCHNYKYIISKYRLVLFKFLQSYEHIQHLKYNKTAPMILINYICIYRDIATYILELVGIDARENCRSPHEHLSANCGFIHHKFYNKGYKHQYNINYINYVILNKKILFVDSKNNYDDTLFLKNIKTLNIKLVNEIQKIQTKINFLESDNQYLCSNLGLCNYKKNHNCDFIHDISDEKALLIYLHDIAKLLRTYDFFNFKIKACSSCKTKSYNAICINTHLTCRVYYNCITINKTFEGHDFDHLLSKLYYT